MAARIKNILKVIVNILKNKMKLKIGDKIFIRQGNELIGYQRVFRITKTMAKTKNHIFDIEIDSDGDCYKKGGGTWCIISGYIANEKLEEEWRKQKIKNWFRCTCDKFSDEEIEKIYKLLNKKNESY